MSVTLSQRALSPLRASMGTILVQNSPPQLDIPTVSLVLVMRWFGIRKISEKELTFFFSSLKGVTFDHTPPGKRGGKQPVMFSRAIALSSMCTDGISISTESSSCELGIKKTSSQYRYRAICNSHFQNPFLIKHVCRIC